MGKRITLYCGNFGSGKTEIALHHAKKLAHEGQKTILVDLDIVNPYFTSSQKKEELEGLGIHVISPIYAGTTVDVPAISAEIYSVFHQKLPVIFDVGGDPIGATALGRFQKEFQQAGGIDMLFVLNAYRPFTQNAADALQMLREIEQRSCLRANGIINNANLAEETTAELLEEGNRVAAELSKIAEIPVCFHSGTPEVLAQAKEQDIVLLGDPIVLDISNRPGWQKY